MVYYISYEILYRHPMYLTRARSSVRSRVDTINFFSQFFSPFFAVSMMMYHYQSTFLISLMVVVQLVTLNCLFVRCEPLSAQVFDEPQQIITATASN